MCAGVDGPSENITYMRGCPSCRRPLWMCNCLSKYSKANKRGGLKKRVNKNRKLTKPLRKGPKNG